MSANMHERELHLCGSSSCSHTLRQKSGARTLQHRLRMHGGHVAATQCICHEVAPHRHAKRNHHVRACHWTCDRRENAAGGRSIIPMLLIVPGIARKGRLVRWCNPRGVVVRRTSDKGHAG